MHTQIFGGLALESELNSVHSNAELANSSADCVVVGRLTPVIFTYWTSCLRRNV